MIAARNTSLGSDFSLRDCSRNIHESFGLTLTRRSRSGKSIAMTGPLPLHLLFLAAFVSLSGCASASREGLPTGSPFAETAAASANLLPQGIAVGCDEPVSPTLVRTDGPMMVQLSGRRWQPGIVSKMATAVAPVARSPLFTTSSGQILPWQSQGINAGYTIPIVCLCRHEGA
jgi:hypothetical protein